MSVLTIEASKREKLGSKASQAYRSEGQIPLNVSRHGDESLHVTIGSKDAETLLQQQQAFGSDG